ncbi:hypothetical protein F5884DRAFT_820621 [Xylogone sp. PMI_703]|nr:hypothetical protein F5884DRAFT_820621 [Xylogone sp. PMI_703]
MGVLKRTRKFGAVKRTTGQRDVRLSQKDKGHTEKKLINAADQLVTQIPQMSSSLFFQYNTALVPPYSRKLPLLESMMDALLAKCTPVITSCVMAELEKLGPKYRIALRLARDERFERLQCTHSGTYADQLRRISGVPILSVAKHKYVIERLPGAPDK